MIGLTAVGKSTAGWHALRTLWQEGRPAAFVDAQQLGFVHPRPSDAFVRAQISILLHGYQRAGATVALLVSRDPVLARPRFGEGAGALIRLAADPDALARRVESRARGSSALPAGDELRAAPAPTRRAVLPRALREAEDLARACPDLPVVDSSRQAAEATAAALLEHLRSSVLALRSLPPGPGTVRLVLNRDRILETAIAQGLDRFSMAGVSRELGVTDMALYRYVGSREELYSLAAARAHATFQFRLEGTDWRAHLVEVAEQTWQLAARHPGIERYLLDGPYHPETLRVFDASIAGFRALAPQFSADQAYVLLSRVVSFTLAAADNALSRRWQPDPGEPSALFRWTVEALVDGMVGRLDDLPTDPSARGLGPESAISPSRS
ncbi:TetR/AcrR family transcriptional regulator [Pseudonocardia oroxyli]|uniref:Transcriptional regulator, TetR family n=1 Tax=Pseudonocardia oroxyli TaxID=366584 RepID=A0A1G7TVE9_PSEOR|nr:TetR/AcrR family transcriptional regulator [Pseudonocardia oroxyli]SDG39307.1 transcriptional regulator, TetR family [Pseudonocardia oroxyli]